MAQNIFLKKKYYIIESTPDNISYPISSSSFTSGISSAGMGGYGLASNTSLNPKWDSSCTYIYTNTTSSTTIVSSSIIENTPTGNKQDLQNGKPYDTSFNILEIYEYITLLVNNFSRDYTLATSCDIGSRYKPHTGNGFKGGCCNGADMQDSCKTFANFTDNSYNPNFNSISSTSYYYNSYKPLNINEFIYDTSNSNQKRSLCQQFNDISGLVNTFNDFLKNDLQNITSTTTSSTQFSEIQASYSQMIQLRNKLDLQLQNLMNKRSNTAENKLQLDSTVYTTVLWTVLVTSVLYYVFIKL